LMRIDFGKSVMRAPCCPAILIKLFHKIASYTMCAPKLFFPAFAHLEKSRITQAHN